MTVVVDGLFLMNYRYGDPLRITVHASSVSLDVITNKNNYSKEKRIFSFSKSTSEVAMISNLM